MKTAGRLSQTKGCGSRGAEMRVTRKVLESWWWRPRGRAHGTTREPYPLKPRLARGADDDRAAAEVEVVVLRGRDDGRRDRAARREQERGQSAARKAVHLG